jgi:hypothetical protein
VSATYAVKCDECKATIRMTMSERESFAGGRCLGCAEPVPPTSLSRLDDHDWSILSNRWARGAAWCVFKCGSRWRVADDFGRFPLFKTKTAACEAVDTLICWESRHRAQRRLQAERK